MINFALIVIVLAIVAAVVIFLCCAKKKGKHCVGCPYAKKCGGDCSNMK